MADDTPQARVLVVDDERSMREMLSIVLKREGYHVTAADNGTAAVAVLEREPVDVLLSDIRMPDLSGVEVLRAAKAANPGIIGIMMTAFASKESAVEAMRLGAVDYLDKPFNVDELKLKIRQHLEKEELRRENVRLKAVLNQPHAAFGIVGRSQPMLELFQLVETIGRTNSTVLITGESGTGKELVARAIHFQSLRRDRPFVAVNCGALTETLLESELFGHVRGAFTGAETNKKGLVELADKGTIFLDEIGEMSPTMQVKVLRVLQERQFRRVGGAEETAADIRVIAATHRDLAKLVADEKFREDLYYRLSVIPIHLPPLRERCEDIPMLAAHFLEKHAREMGKAVTAVSQAALELLQAYPWPGNVRELENVIERAVALEKTPVVLPETLPAHLRRGEPATPMASSRGEEALPEAGFNLEAHLHEIERTHLERALKQAGGVQVRAAELLGLSFRQFRYLAKKYGLR
ncbi:MAG: sigma-54 dependent transcriptional regulator [Vicinamibacterales bacterium]|nr:sigma-54 dependent transcriptional regulator [Vicinamibacterales bacterium]